jgi:hypothetical protein
MSSHNDEEWIKKWINRIQNESDVSIHSNGISHDARYQRIWIELPEPMRPLFDTFIHSIVKPHKTDE